MDKAYSRIIWQNQPSTATALGATNLNRMDVALNTIDDRVVGMDTSKANQSVVNNVVQSITYNDATGVLTITKVNGTSTNIDTKLEKLAVNFSYNPSTQQLDITLDDGTVQHVDMSALVTQYEFLPTDTISWTIESDGKIKANIINGSITADKLQPDYLADIIVQANIATTQSGIAIDAAEYALQYRNEALQYRNEAEGIVGVGIADADTLGLVKGSGNVVIDTAGEMNVLNLVRYMNKVGNRVSISGSDWAAQSGKWTAVNSPTDTFLIDSGGIHLSGTNSANINALHYYNLFETPSKRFKITAKIICNNDTSAGNLGLLFSMAPINVMGSTPFQWMLCLDTNYSDVTNRIICYFDYLSTKSKITNAKLPNINAGDTLEMTLISENSAFYIEYKNLNQNVSISQTVRFDSLGAPPNTWCLGVGSQGGSWLITEISIDNNEIDNVDLLFLGDSISSGVAISQTGRDFPAIIADRFPAYSVSRFSSGWDGMFVYVNPLALQELVAIKPKYAFMLLGNNDMAYGRTLTQMQNDYTTLVNALKAVGTIIIHGGILPNSGQDVRPFNEWIRSEYGDELIVDVFSGLADDGVSPNVSGSVAYGMNPDYAVDGVHPNDQGDLILADVISMFLIGNGIFNPGLMLNNTNCDLGFSVVNNSGLSLSSGDNIISYNTEDYNDEKCFITDTFIAPVSGRYRFTISLTLAAYAAGELSVPFITVLSSGKTYYLNSSTSNGTFVDNINGSVDISLLKGDTVKSNVYVSAGRTLNIANFSGNLIK